jgi:hypothetical protein
MVVFFPHKIQSNLLFITLAFQYSSKKAFKFAKDKNLGCNQIDGAKTDLYQWFR